MKTTEDFLKEEGIEVEPKKNYRRSESPGSTHINKDETTKKKYKTTFNEVADEIEKFLPNTREALKIMLATAVSAGKKDNLMLWLLFVGSPSSGKTELVQLIEYAQNVYFTESFTANSFISGERESEKRKVHDLLPELHHKCFVIKDWTTLFTLYEDVTRKLIGDLVNIYDGKFKKHSPMRGTVKYKTRFSHLGCVTPATLNKHTNYLNMIGARFLFYSIPETTDEQDEKSFASIFNNENRKGTKYKLSRKVSKYLNYLNNKYNNNKYEYPLTTNIIGYLKVASTFIAHARGIVMVNVSKFTTKDTDGNSQENTYYEPLDIQIEKPWRAVQQLIIYSKYLAFVGDKEEVGIEEMEIIKNITLSSMPADRARAIDMFRKNNLSEITAKDFKDVMEDTDKSMSISTARRLLEELTFLGILEKDKGMGTIANLYKIKEKYKDFILVSPAEFMNAYSVQNELIGTVNKVFLKGSDKNE